ncbi:MAG: (2,3-dihydroxybenzoyl)adenylate synthase [Filifactoraceae bacterium]
MHLNTKEKLSKFYEENVWEHLTVGEHLNKWVDKYNDRIAIVDEDLQLTYRQLKDEVNHYANGLLENGFKKGDKILIQLPNCKEFIIVLFAMMSIGVIPVIVLMGHRTSEVKGILDKSDAKGYIGIDKYLSFSHKDMMTEVIEDLKINLQVYLLGNEGNYKSIYNLRSKNIVLQDQELNYKDVAILLLSGGTTGSPKLIPNKHCEFIYLAKELANVTNLNIESVYLTSLPMSHKFTLCCPGMIGTLSKGGKVVMCKVSSPDEIFPLIEEHKVTMTALVPTLANMCLEFLNNDESDITSLEYVQIGGSVLEASLAKRIQEIFNCQLLQLYGMSESLITCSRINDNEEERLNTQGKKLSQFDEVIIIDETGKEVPDGVFGEMIVRGPYTIVEYYNLEIENNSQFTNEYFLRTGDRAAKLENGNYKVVGRIAELINRAGEKIIPSEIEEILLTNNEIKDVKIVGLSDELLGERIGVFILEGNRKLTLKEIRNYLIERGLASFKLPDEIKYVEQWPLTSVGKVDKNKLKQQMFK